MKPINKCEGCVCLEQNHSENYHSASAKRHVLASLRDINPKHKSIGHLESEGEEATEDDACGYLMAEQEEANAELERRDRAMASKKECPPAKRVD